MQITIAAATLIVLSFGLQFTKLGSGKKLLFLDLALIIIASMACYNEYVWRANHLNSSMEDLFSAT